MHSLSRNGLENVKEIIERRAARSAVRDDPEVAAFEKKQYEILLGQYVNIVIHWISLNDLRFQL